jgi:hypothetical protein
MFIFDYTKIGCLVPRYFFCNNGFVILPLYLRMKRLSEPIINSMLPDTIIFKKSSWCKFDYLGHKSKKKGYLKDHHQKMIKPIKFIALSIALKNC